MRVLVQHSPSLHTIRWGGTSLSNSTARLALTYFLSKSNLSEEAEDSWKEFDIDRVGKGNQALRWLVWPSITKNPENDSRQSALVWWPIPNTTLSQNMSSIDLSFNQVSGRTSSNIRNISSLQYLVLRDDNLSGAAPGNLESGSTLFEDNSISLVDFQNNAFLDFANG